MTAPAAPGETPAHDPNPLRQGSPLETGSPLPSPDQNIVTKSRLQAAMDNPGAILRGEKITVATSDDSFSQLRGVANPYGGGIYAYEPNTSLLDDYSKSYQAVQDSKAADAAKAASNTITIPGVAATKVGYAGGGILKADGAVATMVQAALNLAANKVPYVWGGTSANGVDCSGLLFYAAKAAGIQGVQRWRAQDYGQLGSQIGVEDARPGDIVYYDEPGNTDHVGIYLGGGKMVAAPTTGETVKIQTVYGNPQYRRVFNDSSFGAVATPDGGGTYSYNQTYYRPANQVTATNSIVRTGVGTTKAR